MTKYKLTVSALLILLGVALSSQVNAQSGTDHVWSIGLEAGPSFSKYGQDASETDLKAGFLLGANLNYSIRNTYGITGKLLYAQKGAKDGNVKQTLNYIEVPVVGRVFFNRDGKFRPNLFAGPSFGFLTGAKSKTGSADRVDIDNYKDIFNTFDLGLTGGLGLNYEIAPNTRFLIDFRYTHGLTDISKTTANEINNQSIAITAGFSIGI